VDANGGLGCGCARRTTVPVPGGIQHRRWSSASGWVGPGFWGTKREGGDPDSRGTLVALRALSCCRLCVLWEGSEHDGKGT